MRIKKYLPYLAITLLFLPLFASAGADRGGWTLQEVVAFLDSIANWLYIIGFAIALIVIIVGGVSYMTAGGNEDRQKSAKKTIITGLVGAAIILLAGIILDTLVNILGVTPPTP